MVKLSGFGVTLSITVLIFMSSILESRGYDLHINRRFIAVRRWVTRKILNGESVNGSGARVSHKNELNLEGQTAENGTGNYTISKRRVKRQGAVSDVKIVDDICWDHVAEGGQNRYLRELWADRHPENHSDDMIVWEGYRAIIHSCCDEHTGDNYCREEEMTDLLNQYGINACAKILMSVGALMAVLGNILHVY